MSLSHDPLSTARSLAPELLDRAPWGIYVVGADFRIAYMNRSARAGTFRNVAEPVGRPFGEAMRILWPEAVAREIVDIFCHTLDTGESFRSSDFIRPRNDIDAVEGYEWELQQVRLPSGEKGVICYYYDSTLLRSTQQALRRSERAEREALDRNAAISEATPDFVWVSNAQGRVEYVNSRWTDYTGYTLERLNQEGWQGLNHPDDLPMLEREWAAAMAARRPVEVEFRYRRHDGCWRWFLGRTVPMLDAQGEVFRWVGITTDIHDRKLMEDELRAKALALQEADEQKNRFLATLAHELRNPLAPIRSAAALLHDQTLAPERIGWVSRLLQRQVSHMAVLLDDLLDISRISAGKFTLRREVVVLAEVIERAVDAARPLMLDRKHALTVTQPGGLRVHADPVRLGQVLTNLLTNAAKYTPQQGSIELEAHAEGRLVRLRVRDNGIGIDEGDMPRLFRMFSQLGGDSSSSSGGLGIGLALTRGIVELHGGRVGAKSRGRGLGSEFLIELPDAVAADDMAAQAVPPAQAPATPRQLRILIADDNVDAADSLAALMELWGHAVLVVHDGAAALAAVEQQAPDICILDIGMPALDGYATARRIRQLELRQMQLVALTGWGQREDVERALTAGFDVHLTKPVDPERLRALVDAGG